MTIDTDKLKALALAATPGPWFAQTVAGYRGNLFDVRAKYQRGVAGGIGDPNDAAYIAATNPATVLELIAEVERLRADAARLDFMITDECQIERMDRIGAAPVYRVRWPYRENHMREWSASGREAIDTAIAAKGAPCGS
jgi:hypothetical protein